MAEVSFREFRQWLDALARREAADPPPPVFLIHGEPWFVREAFDRLVAALLPGEQERFALEAFEGAAVSAADVLAALWTYSLLGPGKVVVWRDAPLFAEAARAAAPVAEARRAMPAGDPGPEGPRRPEASALEGVSDARPLESPRPERSAESAEAARRIEEALARGVPARHHLVLTCTAVDRRRSLFRALQRGGVVIDCSVPRGERRAERIAREAILEELARPRLAAAGKTMGPAALAALRDLTGFEPGVFVAHLQTLIAYAGEKTEITAADVTAVLSRSRTDPLFELTQALGDRDRDRARAVLKSLLDAGTHPLGVLAAVTNLLRRLIVAEDFLAGPGAALRRRRPEYGSFQKTLWPAVLEYDRGLAGGGETGADADGETAGGGLRLARNPGSAYPVFVLLGQAAGFSRAELAACLTQAAAVEAALKSSTLAPRLALERLAERICRRGGGEG
ncbi:MAG: hypothetical protein WHT06_02880 [Desulfobacterales bacterium]